jgi:geranylgeranyl transferase type-2 subunit beta
LAAADFFSLVTGSLLVELATGSDVFAAAGNDRREATVKFFAPLRRPDGGYGKTPRSASSTYQTFLAVLAKALAGAEPDEPEPILRLIRGRRRPDGGFAESDWVVQGGTNPTAAAVAVLAGLEALTSAERDSAVEFLRGMAGSEGGLRASARAPTADLLSTFTGLRTLADLNAAAARRFVLSLEQPGGGFFAGTWDRQADVEYTFYGLGALAMLPGSEA